MGEPQTEVVITARYQDNASAGIKRLADDLKSLSKAGETISAAEGAMARAAGAAESFRERYVTAMQGMATEVTGAIDFLIKGGYLALAEATARWAASGEFAAKAFAKAMLEMSAHAVLAIGQQAAVKAIFALAEGLLFKDPSAFAAAKLYGVISGVAFATGTGMLAAAGAMGVGGAVGGRGAPGGGAPTGYAATGFNPYGNRGTGGTTREKETSAPVIVNVNVEGHVVDTRAFVQEHVAPALAEAIGRGAAMRGQYNLIVKRD